MLRFAFSETSGVFCQEDEPFSGRHAAMKRAVERYKHHMSCLDTSVTNDPCLASSITHDNHNGVTNATWKHTGRSQIRRAGSHHVQALREQRIEEQELALDVVTGNHQFAPRVALRISCEPIVTGTRVLAITR